MGVLLGEELVALPGDGAQDLAARNHHVFLGIEQEALLLREGRFVTAENAAEGIGPGVRSVRHIAVGGLRSSCCRLTPGDGDGRNTSEGGLDSLRLRFSGGGVLTLNRARFRHVFPLQRLVLSNKRLFFIAFRLRNTLKQDLGGGLELGVFGPERGVDTGGESTAALTLRRQ